MPAAQTLRLPSGPRPDLSEEAEIAANAVTAPKVKDAVATSISPSTGDCDAPGAGSYYPPMGWKDSEGIVHLQGGLVNCTGPLLVVLPTSLRPSLTLELSAFSGASVDFAGSVVISPNGEVQNSTGDNGGIHHLDGITFKP